MKTNQALSVKVKPNDTVERISNVIDTKINFCMKAINDTKALELLTGHIK
jgi:hypothetical protein